MTVMKMDPKELQRMPCLRCALEKFGSLEKFVRLSVESARIVRYGLHAVPVRSEADWLKEEIAAYPDQWNFAFLKWVWASAELMQVYGGFSLMDPPFPPPFVVGRKELIDRMKADDWGENVFIIQGDLIDQGEYKLELTDWMDEETEVYVPATPIFECPELDSAHDPSHNG